MKLEIFTVNSSCTVLRASVMTSVITDPVVVDRILAHKKKKRLESPFAARAPPAA